MATESKVQKVARGVAPRVQRRIGACGHEIIRVLHARHKGRDRLRWWCETCALFKDKIGE